MNNFINRLRGHNSRNISLFFYLLISLGIFFSSYMYASHDFTHHITSGAVPAIVNYDSDYETEVIHEGAGVPLKDQSVLIEYKTVPILIYHYIRDEKTGSDLVMPKHKFREQMKYLKDNKYTTITLDELYSHFKNGTALPEKPIVITIDDGDKDLYANAFPILKEFNFKATFFVISGRIDKHPNHLSSQELINLQDNGMDIESHTVYHEKLDNLTYAHQLAVLQNSKVALEKLLKKEVNHIAYPYGAYNDDTLKAVRDSGYKTAVSGIRGLAGKADGLYELHRIYIGRADGMKLFKKVLSGDFSLK